VLSVQGAGPASEPGALSLVLPSLEATGPPSTDTDASGEASSVEAAPPCASAVSAGAPPVPIAPPLPIALPEPFVAPPWDPALPLVVAAAGSSLCVEDPQPTSAHAATSPIVANSVMFEIFFIVRSSARWSKGCFTRGRTTRLRSLFSAGSGARFRDPP